jgi:hypothetical protein
MASIFKKALTLIVGDPSEQPLLKMPKNRPLKKITERELLQLESEIGAKIFGDIPAGTHRQFFCLDEKTWIWHEQAKNPKTGKLEDHTIRYEVHENGVLKVQEGARYSYLEGEELDNLVVAARVYCERVAREVYHRDPHTGQVLA